MVVFTGNFLNECVLGYAAGGRARYGGMQTVVEITGDYYHVLEMGGGWVVRGAAQSLYRDRGTAAALISFLVR